MRMPFLSVLFTVVTFASVHGAEAPISVTVAIPAYPAEYLGPAYAGARWVPYRNRNSHFHVIVSNTSNEPQRIWQERSPKGYAGLTFEFKDELGKTWVARKKRRDLSSPPVMWWTMEPQESLVLEVYFGDTEVWEGFPPDEGRQRVTMHAALEFGEDDESRKRGILSGRVASKPQKYIFEYFMPPTPRHSNDVIPPELTGVWAAPGSEFDEKGYLTRGSAYYLRADGFAGGLGVPAAGPVPPLGALGSVAYNPNSHRLLFKIRDGSKVNGVFIFSYDPEKKTLTFVDSAPNEIVAAFEDLMKPFLPPKRLPKGFFPVITKRQDRIPKVMLEMMHQE